MPTVIGAIFFLASTYLFFREGEGLFGLVIVSSVFEASSVISAGDHGVQPYYFVAAIFVLQSIYRGSFFSQFRRKFGGKSWMLVFGAIGLSSALILPRVFAGIPVCSPYAANDEDLILHTPLVPGLANVTQSVYLVLDILVVLGAARAIRFPSSSKKAYVCAFYILAGIVTLQFLCSTIGIQFPYALLQNHQGYAVQPVYAGDSSSRYPGTFTESSGAGMVLATCTAGFLAEALEGGGSTIPGLVGLFAIFLVRSTGSLMAIGVVVASLLISRPIYRYPFTIDFRVVKRSLLLIAISSVALVLVLLSPLKESLVGATLDKQAGESYAVRIASDAYSLELFVATRGVGVGLGSNRPSSLLTSLLSNVGLVGTVAYLACYILLLRNARGDNAWLRWAGFALFLDIALSGPDIPQPWVWVLLALAVHIGISSRAVSSSTKLGSPITAIHTVG